MAKPYRDEMGLNPRTEGNRIKGIHAKVCLKGEHGAWCRCWCHGITKKPTGQLRNDAPHEAWFEEEPATGEVVDCFPVVARNDSEVYHKRYGGCHVEVQPPRTGYDLFAAEDEGLRPCKHCFKHDPHVDLERP